MATKRRPSNYRQLSLLAKNVLLDIRDDFTTKGLDAASLTEQYEGLAISALEQKYCNNAGVARVDFDLALKELEQDDFAKSGPMVPYENPPGSTVVFFGMFSAHEYMYLTEAGYRAAAQMNSEKPKSSAAHVHISGGTFHQSQIGIGEQVTQIQKVDVENDAEVIERLLQLLSSSGAIVGQSIKSEVAQLVEITHRGNTAEVKPVFQKLFGALTESTKQVAWGILTAIITKQMGL